MYDEHQQRINEVDQIEKHLIMAKAASLTAEEKALSTLDQQLGLPKGKLLLSVVCVCVCVYVCVCVCVSVCLSVCLSVCACMELVLLSFITAGPCELPHHLNESLLQQHHLLVPSKYLITSQPSVAAPQRQLTINWLCYVIEVKLFASDSSIHTQLCQAHIHI